MSYYGTYSRLRVHVSATPREVIRAASRKLMPRARYSRAQREARHAFYREILGYHLKERELVAHYRF